MNQNLRELDSYKNKLLASVTHDLKTPLNCINTFIELMINEVSSRKEDLFLRLQEFLSIV